MLDVDQEVAAMEKMTVDQLRARYAETFGEATRSRHKTYLIRRIAWRMQANLEGDLSERARRRAAELANDADLRLSAPRQRDVTPVEGRTHVVPIKTRRRPDFAPLSTLQREYKGRRILVTALVDGFEFDGKRYRSLTAIAKAVTGQHWNGRAFFGLGEGATE